MKELSDPYRKFETSPLDFHPLVVIHNLLHDHEILCKYWDFQVEKFSGMLCYLEETYVIGVNNYHHHKRRMFTISHELGHYFLHSNDMKVFMCDELFKNTNKQIEKEANRFASELLMPEDVYFALLKIHQTNFRAISDKLTVSEEAVRWRYVDLCSKYTDKPRHTLIETVIVPFKEEQEKRNLYYEQNQKNKSVRDIIKKIL